MKKKLLITASTFPRHKNDNVPSFVYDYARHMSEYFEVIVLCPWAHGVKKYEIMDGVKVYRYNYFGNLAYDGGIAPKLRQNKLNYLQVPFFLLFQLLNIIKLVQKYDIEVIHAHWVIPQGLVAVIYKIFFNRKIKILSTAHGTDILGFKGKFAAALKRFVIKNSDRVSCVSNALKNEIGGNPAVIPMGIDTRLFCPGEKQSGKIILFVGRLDEKKGVNYLIDAMRHVQEAKLVIIGDGPEKQNLMNQAAGLNIEFLGAIPHHELPKYFNNADIFVNPSLSEGFGLVCAEALSCGTPVIATDLPAIRDIVQDGVNGLIFEQKNSKMLAEKIIYLLNNPDKMQEMGKNGRKFVEENFGWEIITEKYRDIILY